MGTGVVVDLVLRAEGLKTLARDLVRGPVRTVEAVQEVTHVDDLDGLAFEGHGAGGEVRGEGFGVAIHISIVPHSPLILH